MQTTSRASTPIALAEIFPPEGMVVGLRQRTKQGVIEELVRHLVGLGYLGAEAEQEVVEGVLARERQGSTALWAGVAFPHCRTDRIEKFVGAVGVDPKGVSFDAVDGDPVHSIFLLLAPLDAREKLYEVLGKITTIGRDKGLRLQLRWCDTPEAVHAFLQELDRR
jgi:mannitol/fructose-specific phosphotransferase system IIA component (Ntr-type)